MTSNCAWRHAPVGATPTELCGHQVDESTRPLLDHVVLEKLHSDFDECDVVWRVFARNFIMTLPVKLDALRLALTSGDLAGTIDATVGLKLASQQIGADRLSDLTYALEVAVRQDTRERDAARVLPALAANHLPRIGHRARQTCYLLSTRLVSTRPGSGDHGP